jgi:hypothetical protein
MSQSTFNTTVLCLMMSWQVPAFAQLDSIEQAMIAFIDVSNEAAEELLIESVNINSGTMNFAGVRAVADHMMPHFEAIGFETRWEDGSAFGHAGHLIAQIRGGEGPQGEYYGSIYFDTYADLDGFSIFSGLRPAEQAEIQSRFGELTEVLDINLSRIDGELSYALPNLSTLRTESFAVVSKLA